jgi:hypothetical protein
MAPHLYLVSPLYFDAESYVRLRAAILSDAVRASLGAFRPQFLIVDDSAGADPAAAALAAHPEAEVLVMPRSVGHQRAIVAGLRHLAPRLHDGDGVVTLDGDGEDRPEDLARLVAALGKKPGSIVVAVRTSRTETAWFKVMYFFFKIVTRVLLGNVIRSGNFAAFNAPTLKRVIGHRHFDLCYSSGLLSVGVEIQHVPCPRGRRYAGRSRMSPFTLVRHGLQMLLPFASRITARGRQLAAALVSVYLFAAVARVVATPLWPRAVGLHTALTAVGVVSLIIATGILALCAWLTWRKRTSARG